MTMTKQTLIDMYNNECTTKNIIYGRFFKNPGL